MFASASLMVVLFQLVIWSEWSGATPELGRLPTILTLVFLVSIATGSVGWLGMESSAGAGVVGLAGSLLIGLGDVVLELPYEAPLLVVSGLLLTLTIIVISTGWEYNQRWMTLDP